MNASNQTEFTLDIKRIFKAPPDAVYKAWTTPESLVHWFAPDPTMTVEIEQLDLKVGGRYQFKMIQLEGETYIVTGEYLTVTPSKQLVFTWSWIHGDDKTEMLVTLNFKDLGDSTELQLIHERLPSQDVKQQHNEGWVAIYSRLATYIEK